MTNGFVADGYERTREAIRAQVEAEYAEQLKKASPEEAARLKPQMAREIEERLRTKAPREALY